MYVEKCSNDFHETALLYKFKHEREIQLGYELWKIPFDWLKQTHWKYCLKSKMPWMIFSKRTFYINSSTKKVLGRSWIRKKSFWQVKKRNTEDAAIHYKLIQGFHEIRLMRKFEHKKTILLWLDSENFFLIGLNNFYVINLP